MRTKKELFPDLDEYTKPQSKLAYIHERLDEMAENDELFLTECLAIGTPVSDWVAKAVLGHAIRKGKEVHGQSVKRNLARFDVTLRAIEFDHDIITPEGKPCKQATKEFIQFSLPRIELEALTKKEAEAAGMAGDIDSAASHGMTVPNIVNLGSFEGEVTTEEAIYALRVSGKNVRRARGRRQQRSLWKIEEAHPPGYPEDKKEPDAEPPKPRPRRRGTSKKKQARGKAEPYSA